MNRLIVLLCCLAFIGNKSVAQADDMLVLRTLLETNNKADWNTNEVATFQDGRIVALNLTNKDFGKDGIRLLPPEIGTLSELTVLIANDNDIALIPKELYNCTKLTKLELNNNSIMDLPAGISRLTNLKELSLQNNELNELPGEIGEIHRLVKLQLWGNNFTALPSEIGNLSALEELYLKGNRLTNLPVSVTKLNLKYLDVLDNNLCNLTGPVDKWLRKFDPKYPSLQKCQGDKRLK